MNDPFLAFERSADGETVETVLAADFDWDALEERMREKPQEIAREIAEASAIQTLTRLLNICGEGIMSIDRVDRRASKVGVSFLCACMVIRRGQIPPETTAQLAKTLGVSQQHIRHTIGHIRRKINAGA